MESWVNRSLWTSDCFLKFWNLKLLHKQMYTFYVFLYVLSNWLPGKSLNKHLHQPWKRAPGGFFNLCTKGSVTVMRDASTGPYLLLLPKNISVHEHCPATVSQPSNLNSLLYGVIRSSWKLRKQSSPYHILEIWLFEFYFNVEWFCMKQKRVIGAHLVYHTPFRLSKCEKSDPEREWGC